MTDDAESTAKELMWTVALLEQIQGENGYLGIRILPDGSIAALGDLLYTRAIYLGCTRLGWDVRFCFQDRDLATQRFAELESEDDEPEGYTARRPGNAKAAEKKED